MCPYSAKHIGMLRNMFLLFTAIDFLAISALLDPGESATKELAVWWLLLYSSVAAWALGARAWKECQGDCPRPQALLRILTCSSLFFSGCAAAVQFAGKSPEGWIGVFLFLVVYLIRLLPAAAATILVSPFLWICQPKIKTVPLLLICQACCWYGGWAFFGGQPGWREVFLQAAVWIPGWSYALMVGGVMLRLVLPAEKRPPA